MMRPVAVIALAGAVVLLSPTSSIAAKKPHALASTPTPAVESDSSATPAVEAPAVPELQGVAKEAQQLAKQGMAEIGRNDLASASRDFEKVLELAPDNPPALINLGLIAYRQKEYATAESRLKRVLRIEPEAGAAWLILGMIYYNSDKIDAALAALAQAVLYEPNDATAHQYFGVTLGKKQWYSAAEDEMRRAIELKPDYAEAHFNLAVFYLQRIPPAVELARRHYRKALDLGAAPDDQVAKAIEDAP